jgi:hypothetical protein
MNQQNQGQADPKLALQYLGEVAQTYASGLKPVEQAPFVNQVNVCMQVINEDRERLVGFVESLQAEVTELKESAED